MSHDNAGLTRLQRPPRLIGWRVMLVSALLGVVCAVASVPLSVLFSTAFGWHSGPAESGTAKIVSPRDRLYMIDRVRDLGTTRWYCSWMRIERSGFAHQPSQADLPGLPRIEDPRPGWARAHVPEWPVDHVAIAAGFPMLAAHGHRTEYEYAQRWDIWDPPVKMHTSAWNLDSPTTPLWSGLLFNTFCYTTTIVGFIVFARTVRRARRRRRNRCIACAFDLSATPIRCPECGTTNARPTDLKPWPWQS